LISICYSVRSPARELITAFFTYYSCTDASVISERR
jgi:hypothetical protein